MKNNNFVFDLNIFSKYRMELMGVATILIILVHTIPYNVQLPSVLKIILANAGLGVDIFLFLSGMGMYNSYSKKGSSLHDTLFWYYKRYIRIITPLILIALPLIIFNPWGEYKFTVFSCIAELSGFGNLFGYGQLWFLPCILLLYLMTPLFDTLCHSRYKYVYTILCICVLITGCYIANSNSVWIFLLQRWPSYILGYVLALDIKNHQTGSLSKWFLTPIVSYMALYLCNHIFSTHFSLFWLQGIPVMVVTAIFLDKISATPIHKILYFTGFISLESYITNDYILRALQTINWTSFKVNINYGNYLLYFGGTIICIVVSVIINRISRLLINRIS